MSAQSEWFPASYVQEQFVRCTAAGWSSTWTYVAFRLRGPVDTAALDDAVAHLVARHPALRTTLVATHDDGVMQRVSLHRELPVERLRIAAANGRISVSDIDDALAVELLRPAELAAGADLSRAMLASLGREDHVFLLSCHHAVSDLWSAQILEPELLEIYHALKRGEAPRLGNPRSHPGALAARERSVRHSASEAYWSKVLRVRTDGIVGLGISPPQASTRRVVLESLAIEPTSAQLVETLRAIGRACRVPFGITLVAAISGALVSAATRCLTVALVNANRSPDRRGTVGCLADFMLLHIDLEGDPTFSELIARANQAWRSAHEHRLPFGLVHDLHANAPARWCDSDMADVTLNFRGAFDARRVPIAAYAEGTITRHLLSTDTPRRFADARHIAPSSAHVNVWVSERSELCGDVTWTEGTRGAEPVQALSTRLPLVIAQATANPELHIDKFVARA